MKTTFRQTVAATFLVLAGTGQAASVNVNAGDNYNGLTFSGSTSLVFSDELINALDVVNTVQGGAINSYGAGAVITENDAVGAFAAASATAPISSLSIDTTTNAVSGLSTT